MALRVLPANHLHKTVDVATGFGAKVHVIGVFVHIERQNWRAASQRMAMIGRPLVDELAITWRPRQQHPSRAAAERLSHGDKLGAPTLGRLIRKPAALSNSSCASCSSIALRRLTAPL